MGLMGASVANYITLYSLPFTLYSFYAPFTLYTFQLLLRQTGLNPFLGQVVAVV